MPNRLARETSPYLQQHADNPVDWHAWGSEALTLARESGRPILLSVGYSACHWCHVMAHESFEDEDTAALMNRHYVNIKVDREERPDIDQIYQTAHQLMTRRAGGWPLTMFLTPEGKPFLGGTYFPKRSRYNLPGFDDLLTRVAEVWRSQREQAMAQGDEVVRYLGLTLPGSRRGAALDDDSIDRIDSAAASAAIGLRDATMQSFDSRHGGFGGAPKFPHPSMLAALLRSACEQHDDLARDAVLLTLRHMAEGGLYDQLGGGFYRYSTDERWEIPHFEKMLYDNGPLLRLYAEAWQLTGDPLWRRVCDETAGWLLREMQGASGGYFSSIDADSEGEEGRFYVWQREEVERHLADEAGRDAFMRRFGLDGPPNFEGHAWHLRVASSVDALAAALGGTPYDCESLIDAARARLLAVRGQRVHPGRDEKVLTSWNALAIEGMAFAARVFGEPRWAASARAALDFIRGHLWRDGRLLATARDGHSHLNAYLDDHAFLLAAVIELMQLGELRAADVQLAQALAELLLSQFEDVQHGGFFFTSHDHEALVMRPKAGHDGATASGNGVAALQLQRLGHLLGEPRYLEAAQRTMALFAEDVVRSPQGHASLVCAMAEHGTPPTLVFLTGADEPLREWREALGHRYQPQVLVLQLPADTSGLPEVLTRPQADRPQAWVCMGTECLAPISDMKALLEEIDRPGA